MASSSQTAYNPLLEGEPPVGDGAGSPRVEMLNLIGENIIIDDQDAAVVLVFPRELSTGGTVDPKQIIQDPLGKCKSIFVRPSNPLSSKSLEEGFELLEKDGPVDAALYQSVVREGVSRVLAAAGLTLKSFTGIDGDEIFLKVHAPLDGKMIRKLAQRFKYKVPYMHKLDLNDPSQRASSLTATKEMRGRAQSKPHAHPLLLHQKTMDMFTGVGVPAYIEFDEALDHDELEFRHIDAVRMVLLCIDEWLDLAEMAKQNIITRHFPAAQYDDVQSFNEFWSSLSNVHRPPSHAREDAVRDYFGEKVAFFFHWFCFYCWSLRFLGLAGLLCALRRLPILDLSLQHQRWVQIVFSIALCSWAAVFNETFIRKTGEKKQRWGMMDGDSDSPDRPAYNRNLEGTYCLAFWRLFLQAFVVGFCCLYALWLLIFEVDRAAAGQKLIRRVH